MLKRAIAIGAALLTLSACDFWRPRDERASEGAASDESAALDLAQLDGRIVAAGQAPTWRLDADPQVGVILRLDDEGLVFSSDYAAPIAGADGAARVQSGPLALTLHAQSCTADARQYPMTATLQVEERTLTGCAFMRWDQRLSEFLPAIDACLARAGATAPVLYAAPEADGRVLVRLASHKDCRAGLDPASGPLVLTDADPSLRPGGERDVVFYRAPGENPGGACYEAPEVRDPGGALLGWLDDAGGCAAP